eukprot:CAMPEP_0183817392 /NCGR_PEP_ID=MMETSP0803_2-20130417/60274_1 /TAXON_ID=195967 /ORGANISM="Crustomastix stigmata, Strain CCMP3273" /LENGTH=47 /DNA_ID= /DNA_START= /DNA_END= /DNA_ORIENTATION=
MAEQLGVAQGGPGAEPAQLLQRAAAALQAKARRDAGGCNPEAEGLVR